MSIVPNVLMKQTVHVVVPLLLWCPKRCSLLQFVMLICRLIFPFFPSGLSASEVDLAIVKAKGANPNLGLEGVQALTPLNVTPPPFAQRSVEWKRSWKDYAFITVIVAGVSYVIVMVVKVSVVCVCVFVCFFVFFYFLFCVCVCVCVWVHVYCNV